MTQQSRFYRKIIYIIIIAVLIFPLYMLGSPAQFERGSDGKPVQDSIHGGWLAQLRNEEGLAETNLGAIDPAGSTMKLATFGMRGVAVALLWHRSLEYEKRADWDNVVATGNEIIMLEPHFVTIWDFVGWKLAYNASAQFDDYRQRYEWVIRGFNFLKKGTEYNSQEPRLYSKAGWTISQKIGIADEKNQYRRQFRKDAEFHKNQNYNGEWDNWLFGREYYLEAERLKDNGGSIGKETRLIFYSRSRMNLIRYAEWMEMDGCGVTRNDTPVFDADHAAAAWKHAEAAWKDFTKLEVETTIEDKTNPGKYRFTSLQTYVDAKAKIEELTQKLESMLPKGMNRNSIAWDRWNKELTNEQRASLLPKLLDPRPANDYIYGEVDAPYRNLRDYLDGKYGEQPKWKNWRTDLQKIRESFYDAEQLKIVRVPEALRTEADNLKLRITENNLGEWEGQARGLIIVTPEVLAGYIKGDGQLEARDICDEITRLEEEARFSGMFRDILDYNRHYRRVVVEQQEEARKAREYRYNVSLKYRAAQHEEANQAFLKSMEYWTKLLAKPGFEDIAGMPQFLSDFHEEIDKYVLVLDKLETVFPEKFPFQDLLRNYGPVKSYNQSLDMSIAYIKKMMQEKNFEKARDYAEHLMGSAAGFNSGSEKYQLAPLPEIRDKSLEACRLYIEAFEKLPAAKLDEAKTTGLFENYPLKTFLELMVNKAEPSYKEVQKEETLAVTEPAKAAEHLDKAVKAWEKILVKYPILKYDNSSEFKTQIQQTARAWMQEQTKSEKKVPDNFPLKAFL